MRFENIKWYHKLDYQQTLQLLDQKRVFALKARRFYKFRFQK